MDDTVVSERFSRIPFPVHTVSASTPDELFKLMPGLKRYFNRLPDGDLSDLPAHKRSSWLVKDLVRIVKYIVLLYDPESDLTFEYPDDYRLRKDVAAKEAGFERDSKGEWPDFKKDTIGYGYSVVDVLDLRNPNVCDWVLDYLKYRKNSVWMEIVMLREEIDALYRKRFKAVQDSDVKSDTSKIAKEKNQELELVLKKFFVNHNELKKKVEEELFPVSPENVFLQMKFPAELTRIRQINDVRKDPGVQKV